MQNQDNSQHIDYIDKLLTSITVRIATSSMSDDQKAEVLSRISIGLHKLTWPILVSHIPIEIQSALLEQKTPLTLDQYTDVMLSALKNPTLGEDVFNEVYAALSKVDDLLNEYVSE